MVDQQALAIVRSYLGLVRERGLPVRGAVLYGSYARGDQRPDSDIDVLVIVDDMVRDSELRSLWTELGLLAIDVDVRIETVPIKAWRFESGDPSAIVHAARTEGIPIAA